ncbi:hypothetical protein ACN469_36455 [Corallococcus terminator]
MTLKNPRSRRLEFSKATVKSPPDIDGAQLQSLTVVLAEPAHWEHFWPWLQGTSLPKLQSLSILQTRFSPVVPEQEPRTVTKAQLKAFASATPSLRSLTVRAHLGLSRLAHPHVEALELEGEACVGLWEGKVDFPSVKTLKVAVGPNEAGVALDWEVVHAFFSPTCFPSLVELDVEGAELDAGVMSAAEALSTSKLLRQLEVLALTVPADTTEQLEAFHRHEKRFKHLKTLRLGGVEEVPAPAKKRPAAKSSAKSKSPDALLKALVSSQPKSREGLETQLAELRQGLKARKSEPSRQHVEELLFRLLGKPDGGTHFSPVVVPLSPKARVDDAMVVWRQLRPHLKAEERSLLDEFLAIWLAGYGLAREAFEIVITNKGRARRLAKDCLRKLVFRGFHAEAAESFERCLHELRGAHAVESDFASALLVTIGDLEKARPDLATRLSEKLLAALPHYAPLLADPRWKAGP